MFHAYRADFLTDQLLKKSKFFIAKMKKKNFRFAKNCSIRITMYIFWLISSSWIQIYYSRSKKIVSSPREVVIKTCPLPQTSQIWGKTLCRVHDYGNGHELFDAIKDQPCVAWWRRCRFGIRKRKRTSRCDNVPHLAITDLFDRDRTSSVVCKIHSTLERVASERNGVGYYPMPVHEWRAANKI